MAAVAEAAENTLQTIDDVLDGVEADSRRRQFSFRLAVALAGCAFEAYSSPAIGGCEVAPAAVSGNGSPFGASAGATKRDAAPSVLREVAVNGTETTYISAYAPKHLPAWLLANITAYSGFLLLAASSCVMIRGVDDLRGMPQGVSAGHNGRVAAHPPALR